MDIKGKIKNLRDQIGRPYIYHSLEGMILDILEDIDNRVEINTVRIAERNKPDSPKEELKSCFLCDNSVEYLERIGSGLTPTREIICGCGVRLVVERSKMTKQEFIKYWNRGNA